MLPSRFFCPAIPVTLDEPSSIATIKSFAAILLITIHFFTYNLVAELYIDIVVFVPTGLVKTVDVELTQTFELAVDICGRSQIYYMLAYTGYHLDGAVGQDVELYSLVAPETIAYNLVGHLRQGFLGVLLADAACGYQNIGGITCLGHDVAMMVEIVVLAILGHDADNRYALFDAGVEFYSKLLMAQTTEHKRVVIAFFSFPAKVRPHM